MADTIIRLDPEEDGPAYLMARATAQDARLDWDSWGLLAYLHSLPRNWGVSPADLVKRRRAGRDRVYRMLADLRQLGYITRTEDRDEQGRVVRYVYHVRMRPLPAHPDPAHPDRAQPHTKEETGVQKRQRAQSKGDTELRSVFEAWKLATNRNGTTALDGKRSRAIRARLDDGFTLEQLVQAVSQIPLSDFHTGRHEKTKGSSAAQLRRLSELTLHLRDAEHVEYLLALTPGEHHWAEAPPMPGHVWSDEELLKGGD